MSASSTQPAVSDPEWRLALEQVLDSPEFRQSGQSQRLLRHLVETSLAGDSEQLRERAIGTALFGLEPGYDTAENPIVRVRANELRKRLARYYQQRGPVEVRFEIPARGYRVDVVRGTASEPAVAPAEPEALVVPEPPPPEKRSPRRLILGASVLAVAAVAAAIWIFAARPATSALDRFWSPVLESRSTVLLCAGHPVVYRLSQDVQQKLHNGMVDHYQGQTIEFRLPPSATVRGQDIIALPDQYIGLGSAEAVARINGYLQKHDRDTEIRFGNDLTFSDLRKSPAVLIGAYQNRWTVEFMRGMRFTFDTDAQGKPGVRDNQAGTRWELPNLRPDGQTNEDYVLITRVLRGASGEFVVIAAGITQYGGHTVGEVLSDARLFDRLLKTASRQWASRNMQLLMKVKVIGKTAGPPELIAIHEW